MIYFTADQHYGHENIIKYCKRPFKNANEMDAKLIENHNYVVGKDDDVYVLGDFSMGKKGQREYLQSIVSKLNGRLHLVLGNHDLADARFYGDVGFYTIHYPGLQVKNFFCVHDPALSQMHTDKPYLCGHVHGLFGRIRNVYNVGVDVNEYKPISIDELEKMFSDYIN